MAPFFNRGSAAAILQKSLQLHQSSPNPPDLGDAGDTVAATQQVILEAQEPGPRSSGTAWFGAGFSFVPGIFC